MSYGGLAHWQKIDIIAIALWGKEKGASDYWSAAKREEQDAYRKRAEELYEKHETDALHAYFVVDLINTMEY